MLDLSKLTAQELKDFCRQQQKMLSKNWDTKLKELTIALSLLSITISPIILGIVTIDYLLTNR